jgi:hypothetical protein
MSMSSVDPEDKNSMSEEDSRDDLSMATGTSGPEPESSPQNPANVTDYPRDNEILPPIPRSPQVDAVTISDSSLSPRHTPKQKDDPPALTPERAVRLRRLDPNTSLKQTANDIDELVQLGIRYREQIAWKTIGSEDAERTLKRFRPGEWLNDDAIMETLYRLTSGRDDVHVVQSHDFAAAYAKSDTDRIRRWTTPSLILIPVYLEHQRHWLLVSVHFGSQTVCIHDSGHQRHGSLKRFLSALFPPAGGWATEYKKVGRLPFSVSQFGRLLTQCRL